MNAGGSGAKRKIGGHFGAAVGASNKKASRGGWREEVDETEEGAGAQAVAATSIAPSRDKVLDGSDSGSEEMLDPGTPLPSEDEAEAPPEAAAAVAGDTTEGREDDAKEVTENGAAVEGVVPAAETNGQADASPEEPNGQHVAMVVNLELVIGQRSSATLQVLLRNGLNQDTEGRLAACAPPKDASPDDIKSWMGAPVNGIAAGAVCTFGGHAEFKAQRRRGDGKVGDGEGDAEDDSDGAPEVPANGSGSSSSAAPAANGKHMQGHSRAGILSAPKEGTGLLLTLGPYPQLDKTHTVIGPVIIGRRAVRQMEACAALSGNFEPRQPLSLRAAKQEADDTAEGAEAEAEVAANGEAKKVILEHPFLWLEAAVAGLGEKPFSAEETGEASVGDALDIIDNELNGRDAEIQELKMLAFSRERAEGVVAIEEALDNVQGRVSRFADLDEAQGHQCEWQKERLRHLVRILQKLK